MATYLFTPPTVNANVRFTDESTALQRALFRFYDPLPRGVNVFVLQDGTVTQDTPTSVNANSNVPYPIGNPGNVVASGWNPYTNSAYSTTVANPVVAVFYGGHSTQISQAMAAQLTSAGYGAYITVVP